MYFQDPIFHQLMDTREKFDLVIVEVKRYNFQ